MVDTKTSRFGKKAMSLLLSGAMVVAFAPAVGAAVSEEGVEAAYAASAATVADIVDGGVVSGVAFDGTAVPTTAGKYAEVTLEQVNDALREQGNGDTQSLLYVTQITPKSEKALDLTKTDWKYRITSEDILENQVRKIDGTKTTDAGFVMTFDEQGNQTQENTVYTDATGTTKYKPTWTGTISPMSYDLTENPTAGESGQTYANLEQVENPTQATAGWYWKATYAVGSITNKTGNESGLPGSGNPAGGTESYTVQHVYVSSLTLTYGNKGYSANDLYATFQDKDTGKDSYTLTATALPGAGFDYTDADGKPEQASVTIPLKIVDSAVDMDACRFYVGSDVYKSGDTVKITYDEKDHANDVETYVTTAAGKVLTAGTDYKVVLKDKYKDCVTSAVNVGEYMLSVRDNYGYEHFRLYVTIVPAKIKAANYKVGYELADGSNDYFAYASGWDYTTTVEYTGKPIKVTPTFYADTTVNEKDDSVNDTPAYDEEKANRYETLYQTNSDVAEMAVADTDYEMTVEYQAFSSATKKAVQLSDVQEPGTYYFTVEQKKGSETAKNYNFGTLKFAVVVGETRVTYMELDADTAGLNEDGTVTFASAFTPVMDFYTKDTTSPKSVQVALEAGSYKQTLKKATTFTNGKPSGYQTVTSGVVEGPGYYQVAVEDANASDFYTVSKMYYDFQVVAEDSGDDVTPAAEKANQNIKFSTKKRQSVAKGGSMQIKVKGVKTSVTFSKLRGSDYLTVSKSGTLKVNKLAKKGKTYRIKVKAKAKASSKYKADSEYKWFYVTVK